MKTFQITIESKDHKNIVVLEAENLWGALVKVREVYTFDTMEATSIYVYEVSAHRL